jgi:hypothetical protein
VLRVRSAWHHLQFFASFMSQIRFSISTEIVMCSVVRNWLSDSIFTIAVFGDLGAQFSIFEVVTFNFLFKNAQTRGKLIVDLRAVGSLTFPRLTQSAQALMWTDEARSAFIQIVLAESRRLGRTDSGFKKTSWTKILSQFNNQLGLSYTKAQLQSQLQRLKMKHGIYTGLLNNSGFGVCPSSGRPTAPNDVWDSYVQSHPKANEFRNRPLQLFNELHEIFGATTATGQYAVSSANQVMRQISSPSETSEPSDVASDTTASSTSAHRSYGRRNSPPPLQQTNEARLSSDASPDSSTSDEEALSTHESIHSRGSDHRTGKRVRRSNGDRISMALETIASSHRRYVRRKTQTHTQTAIATFLKEYGIGMDPDERIKYVQYFIGNSIAAEAFNVLDTTTQVAFLSSLELD